ncbi:NAD-dependent epimerase/dehydratase family protein [Pseudoalteromonas marina]|uniref:NAD-dependent epimerase/dehydratase family protein n=1 Tax=Pseudoalteromonas marina TaxID=267375 RepID=UPI0023F1700D|nr:SDR family oxidoreductase [Pseudoalteromonas marina]
MQKVTIIGASGFVGSNLTKFLLSLGYDVYSPSRDELMELNGDLGVVIYSVGYGVCDSLINKAKVIDANITQFVSLLSRCTFSRLIYFSSTRVYLGLNDSASHNSFKVEIEDCRKLFNLSKLVAEELCLSLDNAIIVRPSNIYGTALKSPLFLPSIVRNAIKKSHIDMYVTPSYEKDYISVEDVCMLIEKLISTKKLKNKIYNLASGENTTSKSISDVIEAETGAEVLWHDVKNEDYFPVTDIYNIVSEFDFKPKSVLADLKKMIIDFKFAHKEGMF